MSFGDFLYSNLVQFWELTGFANAQFGNLSLIHI